MNRYPVIAASPGFAVRAGVAGPAYAAGGRFGEVSPKLALSSCASGGGCEGAGGASRTPPILTRKCGRLGAAASRPSLWQFQMIDPTHPCTPAPSHPRTHRRRCDEARSAEPK
jgi:hypothetical protein